MTSAFSGTMLAGGLQPPPPPYGAPKTLMPALPGGHVGSGPNPGMGAYM